MAGLPAIDGELFVCGWDEVFLWSLDSSGGLPRKLWSWRAPSCKSLPEAYRSGFRTTDECKPLEGGRKLMIASSDGYVALLERSSGDALFYARGACAHSVELLPGGRLAAALSVGGDKLAVYDLASPESLLLSLDLPSAHGVVWDEERSLLWALNMDELRSYKLEAWDSQSPRLVLEASAPLPDMDGHDLQAVPSSSCLSVTTSSGCWLFDRESRLFSPNPAFRGMDHVKCVAMRSSGGRIAFVQAESPNWWAERVRFLNPSGEITVPGERFYKVRWNA